MLCTINTVSHNQKTSVHFHKTLLVYRQQPLSVIHSHLYTYRDHFIIFLQYGELSLYLPFVRNKNGSKDSINRVAERERERESCKILSTGQKNKTCFPLFCNTTPVSNRAFSIVLKAHTQHYILTTFRKPLIFFLESSSFRKVLCIVRCTWF